MEQIAETLIEEIYDAVACPDRWEAVIRRLCALSGASSGLFFTTDASPRALSLWVRHGISDRMMADYTEYFRDRDPWTAAAAKSGLLSRNVVRRSEELVDEAVFRRSPIFNDLLKDSGIGRLCAVSLADGGALDALQPVLSLYRPADAPPFAEQTVRLLAEIAPHLQRATRLRLQMQDRPQAAPLPAGSALLDHLPMAAFLVDGRQRVLHVNPAGRAMLAQRDGLRMVAGQLDAELAAEARRLHRAFGMALAGRGPPTDVRVSRPSGRASYVLSVLPLSAQAAEPLGGNPARAVVYATDPAAEPQGLEARLSGLFGLTPAECRLVADLLHDLAPAESAERRGVAVSTVRSQLRSVFAKTGTTRQSELLNLVNRCLLLPGARPG